MVDPEKLNSIINEVFSLDDPKVNESRRAQIRGFIEQTINGDNVQEYLVITAKLTKDRSGILVYLLTNARLIKIDIDEKNIQSTSRALTAIVGVERKLLENNLAEIGIAMQDDSFGLRYDADNTLITEFFQRVDLARLKAGPQHG